MTAPPASNFAVTSSLTSIEDGQPAEPVNPVRRIFQTRVIAPLVDLLRVGTSPRRLAWSLAVGVAVGINPIVGSTTLVCLLVAFVFRLNLIASQIANHLVFPLQLTLVVFYMRTGERLFHSPPPPLDTREMLHTMRHHPWSTMHELWTWEWHAIVVWMLAVAVLTPLLATILCPVLARLLVRMRREPAQQHT
jgi:uncharacterized protein (DUF2062 family)